jgi:hypothetical protein
VGKKRKKKINEVIALILETTSRPLIKKAIPLELLLKYRAP